MDLKVESFGFVVSQIRYFAERMHGNFRLYITLTTAIIGGLFWLRVQEHVEDKVKQSASTLAPWLILILAIFMSVQIWLDYCSWWKYRRIAASLSTPSLDKPTWLSIWQEVFMTVAMLGTGLWSFFALR